MNPITSAIAARAQNLGGAAQVAQRASNLVATTPVAAASTVLSLSAQGLDRLGKEMQGAASSARQLGNSANTVATTAVQGVTSTVGAAVDHGVSTVQAVQDGLEATWDLREDALNALADPRLA